VPRQVGRDFSTIGCNDVYEIWGFQFQIIHPNDPFTAIDMTRVTVGGAVAAFDPVTTRDPADLTHLIYTEQFRTGPGVPGIDPTSPQAYYKGCRRETYIQPYWNNPSGQTVYWTDPHGHVNTAGQAPGLLRQEISQSPKSNIVAYKYRQDFCDPTVRIPN